MRFLTATEVGNILGCSRQNVHYLSKKNILKDMNSEGSIRLFYETDVINLKSKRDNARLKKEMSDG